MKALMKTVLVLVGCVSMDPVLAQPPSVRSEDRSAAEIKQRERDWADAEMALDVDKLSQIVADDWVEVIGNSGNMSTKASLLDHVRSGKNKLESCEFGRDDVKVFGNVAVVQASVTERRITDGQSSTFHVVYMDVWVKRGDRWVVVRSQASKL